MTNGVIQLNFPWWYPFVKWLLPIGLAVAAALWVGLSLVGIIPIPASFGMLSWAPVFFSQLDKVAALGVLAVTTGVVSSTVGVLSSLFVRGLLLTTAENVAVIREVNAVYLEKKLQVTEEDSKRDIELAQTGTIQVGMEQTKARDKLLLFVGRVEALFGIKLDEEGDALLKLREPVVFQATRPRRERPAKTHLYAPPVEIEAANSEDELQDPSPQGSDLENDSDGERERVKSSP